MPAVNISYKNNPKGIFYSGQTLEGVIHFSNEKDRKFYSLFLTFEGHAKCKWTKHKSQNHHVTYRGRQNYVNEVINFIPSEERGKPVELAKGEYEYPFKFKIPEYFPTSIEACRDDFGWGSTSGLRGYVRYILSFKALRSWKADIKYDFPITIIKNFDLNFADPKYRLAATLENTKAFSFSSKILKMKVEAGTTGFVCGQTATFLVHYENESSVDVFQTRVRLIRVNTFNSDEPKRKTKTGNEGIILKTFDGCLGKTSKTVVVDMNIPPIPSSSDGSCRVLNVTYEVHFTAVFSGLHSDHTLILPVVIGTVPYLSNELLSPKLPMYDEAIGFPSAPPVDSIDASSKKLDDVPIMVNRHSIGFGWNFEPSTSTNQLPTAPVPTTPEDYDMPPPTYMEATFGKPLESHERANQVENQRDTINLLEFTPSYPVYNFDQNGNFPPKNKE